MSAREPWTLEGALDRLTQGQLARAQRVERAELGQSKRRPMDELRLLVRNFNDQVPEWFSDQYTLNQLVVMHRAWLASSHDVPPQFWSSGQLGRALLGHAPEWTDEGEPK